MSKANTTQVDFNNFLISACACNNAKLPFEVLNIKSKLKFFSPIDNNSIKKIVASKEMRKIQ